MNQKVSTGLGTAILLVMAFTAGYFIWVIEKNTQQPILTPQVTTTKEIPKTDTVAPTTDVVKLTMPESKEILDWKSYKNEKYGFEIKYPKNWFLDGQRLSPQKIEDYEIGSDNAPVSFGVYSQDKEVFLNSDDVGDLGDFEYQIKNSKRTSPDVDVEINGKLFQRHDLVDYGRYEGSSAGNIILFVSPKIGNQDLFVVFQWQQFPGGKKLKTNDPQDFTKIVSTLNFSE